MFIPTPKTTASTKGPAKLKVVPPIPLERPEHKKVPKTSYITFKLRSTPTDENSPEYDFSMQYFRTGTPEELFTCLKNVKKVFVGMNTNVTDVYPLKTEKQFVNTLEDNIRNRGAPSKLVSDRAQVEISGRTLELLRVLCVPAWQSEPHNQWQNPAERRIQYIKQVANTVMDMTYAPPETWLLCLVYVSVILNHLYDESIFHAK